VRVLRKLGVIGGMSWISTRGYYEDINRAVQKVRGDKSSAPMVIDNLDYRDLVGLTTDEDWQRGAAILIESAQRLQAAGAGMIVIAANALHRVYRDVEAALSIPILHIAECVGEEMEKKGVKKAALIGPRNVVTGSFYRRRLVAHGIDLLPPDMVHADEIDRIIYEELIVGRAARPAERLFKTIITEQAREGAQAIVLAATELNQVVDVTANVLPIYDSAKIHARHAARWLLEEDA
jgi:aspartate racemase